MEFYIDFSSDEAYYLQLRKQIILGIATMALKDGECLPSVRDMAERIGINMHTVNKTYMILRQEGYLRLDRRRGAIVSVDLDKTVRTLDLTEKLRVIMAEAMCNGLTEGDVHKAVDEVLRELSAGSEVSDAL